MKQVSGDKAKAIGEVIKPQHSGSSIVRVSEARGMGRTSQLNPEVVLKRLAHHFAWWRYVHPISILIVVRVEENCSLYSKATGWAVNPAACT